MISKPPVEQHGKKLSDMVDEEDSIDVLKCSGGLEIVDGRHHRSVIS